MTLTVSLAHRLGAFDLDVAFEAPPGVTALFGRSGAGKTSIVNAVAGLMRPTRGRIAIDGRVLLDTARGVFVPPHRRRIGYVFQEGRLFPHLSVRSNLLYGRRFTGRETDRTDEARDLDRVVDLLGLASLLPRRPGRLSGGEKQRVALGRALMSAPAMLLMDEPLASLDEARRAEILPFVERLRDEAGLPILYVSHSVAEVARLATTVVLVGNGRVTATGAAATVLADMETVDPADTGAILSALVVDHDDDYALTRVAAAGGMLRLPRIDAAPGTRLRVRLPARDVLVATQPPRDLSALNALAGTVAELRAHGHLVEVRIDCAGEIVPARITRLATDRLGLVPGMPAWAVVKTVSLAG